MVGSRLFVFSLMVIFYEGAKNRETVVVLAFSFVIELFISVVHASFYGLSIEEAYKYSHVDG